MITERTNTADTVELLRECSLGIKTAVKSIDEVLDVTENRELKRILEESKTEHERTGLIVDALLAKHNSEEKELSPMSKAMAWTKINMKLMADKDDKTIAELMSDGCAMGIKTLCGHKNCCKAADKEVIDITDKIINMEDELVRKLRKYL